MSEEDCWKPCGSELEMGSRSGSLKHPEIKEGGKSDTLKVDVKSSLKKRLPVVV